MPKSCWPSWAAKNLSLEELQDCTLYTSAEPCAMCSGAIYWAGIGRVVFGQTERDLKAQTGAHEENPTLDLPCHIVFEAGQRPTEIVGPLLADEAGAVAGGLLESRGLTQGRRIGTFRSSPTAFICIDEPIVSRRSSSRRCG